MRALFSFSGHIGRPVYALSSTAVLVSQHLMVWGVYSAAGPRLELGWPFLVDPLRLIVQLGNMGNLLLFSELGYLLAVAWLLAVLAFRRAADANVNGWIAALAVAPVLQLAVILYLSVAPPRQTSRPCSRTC